MAKWLLTLLLILLPSLAFAQFDSVVIRDPTTGQGACVNPDGTLCTSGGGGGGGTVDQGTGGMSPWAVQFLTPQSIVGTVTANSAAATTGTGSLSADGSTVEFTIPAGTSTVSMYATGNTTMGEGFFVEFSQDGTNWGTLAYIANDNLNRYLDGNGFFFNGADAEMSILPQTFWFNTSGIQKIRMRQGLGVPLTTPIDLTYRAHPNTLALVAVNGPVLDASLVELASISSSLLTMQSLHIDSSDQGVLFDGVNDEIVSILTYPGTVAFSVAAGFAGTVVFECRMSSFHPWEAVTAVLTTRAQVASVSSFPATGIFAGGQNFGACRIRVSAYTSGSSLARLVQVRPGNASVNANAYLVNPTGTFIGTATDPVRIDPTGTTTQPVSALNLDIRDLTFAADKVDATGSVVSTKTDLATNAPASASVGVASAQALAANANRKGVILVNTSANTISCSIGQTAVLNAGITLQSGAAFTMNEYTFDNAAINCIASAASSNLSIQEFQ